MTEKVSKTASHRAKTKNNEVFVGKGVINTRKHYVLALRESSQRAKTRENMRFLLLTGQ